MACLGVCLARPRVEREIFENKVFSGHHLFGQPPWDYVEYIWLRHLGNRAEILHEEKRLTAPLVHRYLKQLVQPVERSFFHPLYQLTPFTRACTQENKAHQPPNNADLTHNRGRIGNNLFIPGTFNDWLGTNCLSECTIKPAYGPLTSTCPLAAPLVESRRPVTS